MALQLPRTTSLTLSLPKDLSFDKRIKQVKTHFNPKPSATGEVRSFQGLMNYYGKFLPDVATILSLVSPEN